MIAYKLSGKDGDNFNAVHEGVWGKESHIVDVSGQLARVGTPAGTLEALNHPPQLVLTKESEGSDLGTTKTIVRKTGDRHFEIGYEVTNPHGTSSSGEMDGRGMAEAALQYVIAVGARALGLNVTQ